MKKYLIVSVIVLLFAGNRLAQGQYLFDESHKLESAELHRMVVDGWNISDSGELPDWIISIEQEDGVFLEQPDRWDVAGNTPDGKGKLVIHVDREKIASDIGMTIICDEHPGSDIAIQLLDDKNRVIAVDLVGNAVSLVKKTKTDTIAIPLLKHPSATKIVLRRITGQVTVYSVIFFPVIIGDDDNADLLSKVDMLRFLKQSLSPESPTYKTIMEFIEKRKGSTPDNRGSQQSSDLATHLVMNPSTANDDLVTPIRSDKNADKVIKNEYQGITDGPGLTVKTAVAELQRLHSRMAQQCPLPLPEAYTVKYYAGTSHSFHRILTQGHAYGADDRIPPSDGKFYYEFYFAEDGHLVYTVAHPPGGKRYVNGHLLHKNGRPFARLTYYKEGLSFGDYVYYHNGWPFLACRILKNGKAVLIKKLSENSNNN